MINTIEYPLETVAEAFETLGADSVALTSFINQCSSQKLDIPISEEIASAVPDFNAIRRGGIWYASVEDVSNVFEVLRSDPAALNKIIQRGKDENLTMQIPKSIISIGASLVKNSTEIRRGGWFI